jgi:serine/threonine protein kinase
MPAPTTTDELLDLVRKSELVPAQRLAAFVTRATAASTARSPREMIGMLIAAGLITHFQAEQFLQGKWRGFTIGKYRVLERLGSGGMGTVYLCEHLQVGRKVAIKVLPTSQAHNPSALGRFYREARAAGVMDHPNLVTAHDIDQDGALHFLVMDYVDGSSLQYIVARFGAMAPIRAAHCIRQAAQGLQHSFQAGWLHRDVKPANIMLERNGTIRVLDLGLARFLHDNTDLLTLQYDNTNVLGTADYVSPEQALDSHDVDIRTDVYSLGATFYFLLTGQPPFPEGKIAQKLIWHQVRQPTPVRQLRPEVPEGIAAIVDRMMEKNPAHRYQTPAEVIEALRPWTTELMPPPREEEMPRLSPAVAPTVPAGTAAQPPHRPRGPVHRRVAAGQAHPHGAEAGCQIGTLDPAQEEGDLATPRVMSSSETPPPAEQPRPVEPLATSKRVRQNEAAVEMKISAGGSNALMLILAVLSAAAGVFLTWALIGR